MLASAELLPNEDTISRRRRGAHTPKPRPGPRPGCVASAPPQGKAKITEHLCCLGCKIIAADQVAVGIERGLVVYRVGKSDVTAVQQVEALLGATQSGSNVNFTVGVIHAAGQNRELGAVSLTAR